MNQRPSLILGNRDPYQVRELICHVAHHVDYRLPCALTFLFQLVAIVDPPIQDVLEYLLPLLGVLGVTNSILP